MNAEEKIKKEIREAEILNRAIKNDKEVKEKCQKNRQKEVSQQMNHITQ